MNVAELRKSALRLLASGPLTKRDLALRIGVDEETAREIVWQLINRREVELTREWKIASIETH